MSGQITKAWELMQEEFENVCAIPAEVAAHIENAALRGAYAYAEYGNELLHICDDKQTEKGV